MGIIISSAKTGKRLYEQNADQLFTPASIQKLYVATAALSYLHPNFTYNTTLSSDVPPQLHTIKGNVYLHFSGNPYLTFEDLQSLLKSLKQNHITRIRGNLILDDHVFDQVPYPPGWLWGDLSYSFAAPLGGGNLDQNKFLSDGSVYYAEVVGISSIFKAFAVTFSPVVPSPLVTANASSPFS